MRSEFSATGPWELGPGILELPDGVRVRGRGLHRDPDPEHAPDLTLALLGRRPPNHGWPVEWVRWPDLLLPIDPPAARAAMRRAHGLAASGTRVEVVCLGGVGRTGTALACMAQLAGVPPESSIAWVRERYHPRAAETPWQRRWVRDFLEAPAG